MQNVHSIIIKTNLRQRSTR